MLTCKDCKKPVWLDVTNLVTAVSPVFEVGTNGVSNPLINLGKKAGGGAPSYICGGCGKKFSSEDELANGCTATCAICTTEFPVGSLYCVSGLASVCSTCLESKGGRAAKMLSHFSISPVARKFSLSRVLFKVDL